MACRRCLGAISFLVQTDELVSHPLVWPAGRPFTRAHSHEFGSTEHDDRAGVDFRFSPLYVAGALVPVLYAGSDDLTAAAETIFRNLPDQHRRVSLDRYRAWQWSQVQAKHDLRLLPLDDTRLLDASVLVDGDATTYPQTRVEAAQLLEEDPALDGLIWRSHQLHDHPSSGALDLNTHEVCLLLVDATPGRTGGARRDELTSEQPVVPFAAPAGVERLDVIADQLDITVVRT